MSDVIIRRVCAAPNKWTFKIPPIAALLANYVPATRNNQWVDPFAGMNSPAQYTNDVNPKMNATYHMLADEYFAFNATLEPQLFDGVLFDPPYSYRQITECYAKVGLKASQLDTSNNFYNRVMNAVCDRIVPGGYAISFGWNTNGFGVNRGFRPVEVLVVAHGQHHNDTLVVVEQRRKKTINWNDD